MISNTEDAIGTIIQELVKIDQTIERLEYMGHGANTPGMADAYKQQLHESRAERTQLRARLAELKTQHWDLLSSRKDELNKLIEESYNAFDVEEMREIVKNIQRKMDAIDEELNQLSA